MVVEPEPAPAISNDFDGAACLNIVDPSLDKEAGGQVDDVVAVGVAVGRADRRSESHVGWDIENRQAAAGLQLLQRERGIAKRPT